MFLLLLLLSKHTLILTSKDLDSLEVWLSDMEQKMDEISEIAIAPDDLNEQSNIVGDLVTAITERDAQITAVIEVGRQLCRQATGDEALPLQYRMDQLKRDSCRYGDIMLVADEKLQLLAKAIPLSERFHEGFDAVMEWVEAVEEDLIQIDSTDLDTQTQVDDELRTAPELTTATPPHQLRKQREHNAELSAAILTYVPIVEQFKSDVKALQEICVPEDGVKLGELADEIVAKYDDMRKAVEARGQALDSIVDATSGLGERLENFVQTLQGASDRLRQNASTILRETK
ncbi:hypothetical protein TELCIR_21662 [Teladorsagia circumcincta]|uniref:PH domain-containing protein n=1 Tax=Teladorsagia circumcincta TaxID=45464 RepID=A0A2G9TG46_TELCI|nr:hypothetical protein TELCIR_21662 [Teladorsagia circumcincta]